MRLQRRIERSGCATGARIVGDLVGQRLLDLFVGHLLAEAGAAEAGDHPPATSVPRSAEISSVLEFLQRRVIEPALGEDAR